MMQRSSMLRNLGNAGRKPGGRKIRLRSGEDESGGSRSRAVSDHDPNVVEPARNREGSHVAKSRFLGAENSAGNEAS